MRENSYFKTCSIFPFSSVKAWNKQHIYDNLDNTGPEGTTYTSTGSASVSHYSLAYIIL